MLWICPNQNTIDGNGGERSEEPSRSTFNNFNGPIENRECRDVIFLVLFILVLGGLGYMTWKAVEQGNPLRIVYGVDSWGNLCNTNNEVIQGVNKNRTGLDLTSKKYLFYFNQNYFENVIDATNGDHRSIRICLNSCPSTTVNTVGDMKVLATNRSVHLCVYDIMIANYFNGNSDGLSFCPGLPIEPHDAFLFHCIPSSISKKLDHVTDAIKSLFDVVDDNFIEHIFSIFVPVSQKVLETGPKILKELRKSKKKAASDLQSSWFEVLLLCGLSIVVGIVLTLVIQLLAPIIVWVMTVAMVLGTLTATSVCWYQYYKSKKDYDQTPDSDRTTKMQQTVRNWLIGSICVTVLTIIVLLIFLAVRKHLKLVVQLFKEAGRCIRDIPSLLLHPFMTILTLCGSFGSLLLIFLYIETAGENVVDRNTGFVTYQIKDIMKIFKWYHIFVVIWIIQFILACHQMAIAGAVASWFFTRDKSRLSFPVLNSIKRLIRFHLGSLALGSLVITFVVFVRIVLSFIENRIRGRTHPVAVYILKCLKCCLWCFEKFLKFLNSNAYIEISIHGYSFCRAARQAFKVVLNNVVKLAVINYVGDFVLFLGKVATVAIVTVVGIELLSNRSSINYIWLPITLAAIFAYFISSCFMSVYEMTMDTIFICFCEDSIMNDGVNRPYFMSVNLMRCLSARQRQSVSNKVGPAPSE